jgi:hypothetical protein
MDTYQDIKKYLESKNLVGSAEIYDYSKDDLKDHFDELFNFCIVNLRTKCEKYKIQPSSLYFVKDFSINAKANRLGDDFIIGINMGTIVNLYPFFTEPRFDFAKKPFYKYEIFETVCKISPEYLMFQFATQFTYYHEQAHLIQKSEILKSEILENYSADTNNVYSEQHHLLEIDADIWGSHFICYHLIEYFKKQHVQFQKTDNLNNLVTLGLSAIFSYFCFLATGKFKIYFKEHKHPHLSIRLSYITDCFLSIVHDTFQGVHQIDKKQLLADTFQLTSEIFKQKHIEVDNLDEVLKVLYLNMDKVKEYVDEMKAKMSAIENILLNDLENLVNDQKSG